MRLMKLLFLVILLAALGALVPDYGWASAAQEGAAGPARLCQTAIGHAEAVYRIPDAFLSAIGRVESGRSDPQTGSVAPWPWTVNAQGQGHFYETKAEAVDAVRALQAQGVRSIDVGCLQVNLMHHPEAFASLDGAFDPGINATFAGSLLVSLFAQTGSWPHAAAAYHSQTPTIGADYQKKVLDAWASPATAAPDGHDAHDAQQSRHPAIMASSAAPGLAWAGNHAITGFVAAPPPAANRMAGPVGRDLAAYRSVPVRLALKPVT